MKLKIQQLQQQQDRMINHLNSLKDPKEKKLQKTLIKELNSKIIELKKTQKP